MHSAHDSIIPEVQEKIDALELTPYYKPNNNDMTTAIGSHIMFRGIKTSSGNQTAKLKSLVGINGWVVEEAEEFEDEDDFEKIDLSIRDMRVKNTIILMLNPHVKDSWIYKRFFCDSTGEQIIPHGFNGITNDTTYIHTNYYDNIKNLPMDYIIKAERMKSENPIKWSHVYDGKWIDEVEGALWTHETIQRNRVTWDQVPELVQIYVAVDPAVTSKKTSDYTGIVVVGRGVDDHLYVLEDATMKAKPAKWARRAVELYYKYQADKIIAEVNNGGDLVEEAIKNIDQHASYDDVRAKRGKILRAEPTSVLYEKNIVHHVGIFGKLENQQITFTGSDGEDSPDNLDALVYACTKLTTKRMLDPHVDRTISPKGRIKELDAEAQDLLKQCKSEEERRAVLDALGKNEGG